MNSENLSKKTADKLIDWIRDYAARYIDSQAADEQRSFPPHVFLELGAQGFFGIHISRQYGGLELTTFDMLRVIEQVAAIDLTLSVIIIESIQGAHTIENYASQTMKDRYLNQLAAGRIFTAGAMTESDAGSNPRAMKSMALPHGENEWVLKGSKRWIGMGASAAVTAVYVQQFDSENHWLGMSGFLVPQGAEGLEIGVDDCSMGIRGFSKNKVTLNNVKVTSEQLLGSIGEGMEIAQDNMMYIRLCLAAAAIGAMKRCMQLMYRYASRRIIATGSLLENPVTLVRLSEISAAIDAISSFAYLIAQQHDKEKSLVPEEAFVVAKILGSELLGWVADNALQLLGARGYEEASDISKIFRDARVFRIFEGPTEALNMYLGARLFSENLDFEKFICKTLGQEQLFTEMKNDINRIKEYSQSKKNDLFNKPLSTHYWSQSLVGEAVSYALVLSCLHARLQKGDHTILSHAILWARNRYDDAVKRALSFSLGEQVLLSASQLENSVSNYIASIGNIEQRRNWKNIAIDPLLQLNPQTDLIEHNSQMGHELFPKKTENKATNPPITGMISELERVQLLNEWNNVQNKTIIPEKYAHNLFEECVLQNGDAIAIVFNDQSISYKELNNQANKVACFLKKVGIGPETVVALYFERSIEMIIALLGVLKSEAAYLPLDFNYPEKSLKFMLEDSGACILLSQKDLLEDCPFDSINTLAIEDVLESTVLNTNPCRQGSLDNVGYVIYTSGSTGEPKGVVLPHRALSNLMYWHLNKINEKRNVLQFTTLNFDMSFIEIFSALCSGGTLTLISEHDRLDLFKFSNIVKNNSIEQLVLSVPFLKSLAAAKIERFYFKSVKEIIIAGEQLVVTETILDFFKQLPSCTLYNYYGPSETHVVTAYAFPHNRADWPDYPPIGKVIANAKILILDEYMQLVPIGTIGEIYIGGVCLANGYLNRAELTQSKFVKDIYSEHSGHLLYRSGDCGKYLEDGTIVYTGRKDEQLKIRGYRIEPQEIEWHLMKYPGIKEAVVIAKKGSHSDKHLEAFLIVDGVNDILIHDIYAFLQEELPPHLLPSVFNIVEKIPLTNSGKIDRIALEQFNSEIVYSISNLVEPETETEKVLVELMEDILKIKIGINHSFFSIGGNSLLAIQIISLIRKIFAVDLPAYSILSEPTIADIARKIDTLKLGLKSIIPIERLSSQICPHSEN